MYRRGGKTSGTANVGPHPSASNYREWWAQELAYEQEMLLEATAAQDARLMRLATRRIKQANDNLSNERTGK